MQPQDTYIYRLVLRKVIKLIFQFDFLGHFWWENGRGHHARLLWFGASKPDQKVGTLGGILDQLLSQNDVLELFWDEL